MSTARVLQFPRRAPLPAREAEIIPLNPPPRSIQLDAADWPAVWCGLGWFTIAAISLSFWRGYLR
jgi:hypothetical protein